MNRYSIIKKIRCSLANKIIFIAVLNTIILMCVVVYAYLKVVETTKISHTMAISEITSIQSQNPRKLNNSQEFKNLHKKYENNLNKYYQFSLYIVVLSVLALIIFIFYVKHLLYPLKILRKSFSNNSLVKKKHLCYNTRLDEIGLIFSAFSAMQIRTLKYSQEQENIHENLARKVDEKTEELRHQLYFDRLTNLPNREALIQSINKIQKGVLLIINIDDFKEINDFFGHQAGDRLLIKFSNRLKTYLDKYSNLRLYRLNGDEFSILLDIDIPLKELEIHTIKLIKNIEKMHFLLEEQEVRIRVSIGATLQMDGAFEKADMALKKARQKKKSYLLYDEKYSIRQEYKENLDWATKIKNAITYKSIIPFYQPIFDNNSGKIVSYECLMRLKERDGTIIKPVKFLEIAKKTRLYPELTKIMIQKSCQHFSTLSTSFSINLSFKDMTNLEITTYIQEQIRHYKVEDRIIFEILESEGIENYEEIASFIHKMHGMGCKIAIDDFGSGYSNYEHLLKLHVDFIKIDGSLIKNIDSDANARIIVQTILDFARKLQIKTVAEFVHNQAILNHIKELEIDRSQGFFLGEPKEDTLELSTPNDSHCEERSDMAI